MKKLFERIQDALTKTVLLWMRQSSHMQAENNLGSQDVQADQFRHLEPFGFRREQLLAMEAFGESGRAGADRPLFEQMLDFVSSGEVGLIVAARGDRLGRNKVDTERLLTATAQKGVLIMIGGRVYDPTDPGDKFMLGIQAEYSEFENNARTRWMVMSRLALARRLAYRTVLPTGLVWASPEHSAYVKRLRAAGLVHWLDDLSAHQAVSEYKRIRHYVLPFPDEQVVRAVELQIRWLLETRDLREVVGRIMAGAEGWPRRGQIPVIRGTRFMENMEPQWIAPHADKERYLRQQVRSWVLRGPLYGTYHFESPVIGEELSKDEAHQARVLVRGAFPSFATPDDERVVRQILQSATRPNRRGGWRGARDHLLPQVRCAHLDDTGQPCGLRMSATYDRSGDHQYRTTGCVMRGHEVTAAPAQIDGHVLAVILDGFRPQAIRDAIGRVRRDSSRLLRRREDVEGELHRLHRRLEVARDKELEAAAAEDREEELYWRKQRLTFRAELRERETSLQRLQKEEGELRAATEEDLDRIFELASDLPRLIDHARSVPGRARSLIGHLIQGVHVRRLTSYAIELDVQFPTGHRVRRLLFTRNLLATQPERTFASGLLSSGIAPDAVAEQMNKALEGTGRVLWDEDRVMTADLIERHAGPGAVRKHRRTTIEELARETGESSDAVRAAVLLGKLGPAQFHAGQLVVRPSSEETHGAFQEFARREIAERHGVDLRDLVPIIDLAGESDVARDTLVRRLHQRHAHFRDDSGRCFGLRSAAGRFPRALLIEYIAEHAPEHQDLDPQYWIPIGEAMKRTGNGRRKLLSEAPSILADASVGWMRSAYVWLSAAVLERLRVPTLAEAVHESGHDLAPGDFIRRSQLTRLLAERFNVRMTKSEWIDLRRSGRTIEVKAAPPSGGPLQCYVYFPERLRSEPDWQTVKHHLHGRREQ